MRRWLVLVLGLAIAATAGYALLRRGPGAGDRLAAEGFASSGAPPPHAEIDEKSEEQLLQILRGADREEP